MNHPLSPTSSNQSPNSAPQPRLNPSRPARWRRPLWIVAGVLTAGLITLVGLRDQISSKAEALALAKLAEHGIHVSYRSRGWLPWKGLTFREVVLSRGPGGSDPMLSLSNLSAELRWKDISRDHSFQSTWRTNDATLVLHDAAGAITIQNVTADVHAESGSLGFSKLQGRHRKVFFDLAGSLRLIPNASFGRSDGKNPEAAGPTPPPRLNLHALRAVLGAVDVESRDKGLSIRGSLSADFRTTPPRWTFDVTGDGTNVEWHGLPVRTFNGTAAFRDIGGQSLLSFTLDRGKVDIHCDKGAGEVMRLSGTARDAQGLASGFDGEWIPSKALLHLDKVSGQANWLQLAGNFPAWERLVPGSVVVEHFPGLSVEDFEWRRRPAGSPLWSVGSVRLTTPAALSVRMGSRSLRISDLLGTGSYGKAGWQFKNVGGKVFGGTLHGQGRWSDGELTQASVRGEHLKVDAMASWLEASPSRLTTGDVSFDYAGTLGKHSQQLTGRGSVRMDNAPVVEIPLLEQTNEFFNAIIPGTGTTDVGRMSANFVANRGVLKVPDFKAASQSVSVKAHGTIDLNQQTLEARARGELAGILGVATSPLSHVLEMRVSGTLSHPQVTPLSPLDMAGGVLLGTAKGAREAARVPAEILTKATSLPLRLWMSLVEPKK